MSPIILPISLLVVSAGWLLLVFYLVESLIKEGKNPKEEEKSLSSFMKIRKNGEITPKKEQEPPIKKPKSRLDQVIEDWRKEDEEG